MSLKLSRPIAALILALGVIFAGQPAPAGAPAPAAHKAFVLIEYRVRDRPLFLQLREKVRATLKTYGGDIVTREKVDPIFGGQPTNLSVISFMTVDAARKWLASKELAELQSQRDKAAQVTTYLVEKLD